MMYFRASIAIQKRRKRIFCFEQRWNAIISIDKGITEWYTFEGILENSRKKVV